MNFKRKKRGISVAGLGIPLLTIFASLGGVYMGQRMVAEGESNKIIREKLALAYNMTLEVPELALAVNTSAIQSVTVDDAGLKGAIYNNALNAYLGKITEIQTINNLYVDGITGSVEALSRCSEDFVNHAINHLLLERRDAGMQVAYPLASYQNPNEKLGRNESLNITAQARVKCELVSKQLNLTIAQVIKKYI